MGIPLRQLAVDQSLLVGAEVGHREVQVREAGGGRESVREALARRNAPTLGEGVAQHDDPRRLRVERALDVASADGIGAVGDLEAIARLERACVGVMPHSVVWIVAVPEQRGVIARRFQVEDPRRDQARDSRPRAARESRAQLRSGRGRSSTSASADGARFPPRPAWPIQRQASRERAAAGCRGPGATGHGVILDTLSAEGILDGRAEPGESSLRCSSCSCSSRARPRYAARAQFERPSGHCAGSAPRRAALPASALAHLLRRPCGRADRREPARARAACSCSRSSPRSAPRPRGDRCADRAARRDPTRHTAAVDPSSS